MSFAKEFKEFAVKGNAVDMAVGIIIGAAFGKVVASLVSDVVMPPLGLLLGNMDFAQLALTLRHAILDAQGREAAPAVLLRYRVFISSIVDFLVVAMSIFLVIKVINVERSKPVSSS